MSDLEQSDLENISDDEVSTTSQEDTQPTFSRKTNPESIKVKELDEGEVVETDYDDEDVEDLEDVESEMDDDQDDFSVDEEGNIAEPLVSEKVT